MNKKTFLIAWYSIVTFVCICGGLTSCGHDHDEDVVVGNVHTLYTKEMNDSLAKYKKFFVDYKKKIIDSMTASFKKAPEGMGWYSSKEMSLPVGTIIDFNPDNLNAKSGPYYIIVRGFDGKKSINKTNREKWLLLQKGDILK